MVTFVHRTRLQTVDFFFIEATGPTSPFLNKVIAVDPGGQDIRWRYGHYQVYRNPSLQLFAYAEF